MRARLLIITSAVLPATLGLAGCASGAGGAPSVVESATAQASAVPALPARLAAAATRLDAQTLRYSLSVKDFKLTGVADTATGHWELAGDNYVVRRIGPDLYVKVSGWHLAQLPPRTIEQVKKGKWIHTPVPFGMADTFTYQPDFPRTLIRNIGTATQVTAAGDLSFHGRIIPWNQSVPTPSGSTTPASPGPAALPFTADLDAEGRLTKVNCTFNSPASGPGTITVTYSDFGKPAPINAPPASDVVEEPVWSTALLGSPLL